MFEMKFTDEDKKKVTEFLNMVAKHSELRLNTVELIQYYKLLSFMQQILLPKIDANVLEIKKITESSKGT